MIIAYENKNIPALNGRLNPSTVISEYEMNSFERLVYDWLIVPTVEYNHHVFHECSVADRMNVADLHDGMKYIYPIDILSMSMFCRYVDKISISDKVLNDARLGHAHIIFVYINEGEVRYNDVAFDYRFDQLIRALNVPKSSIHLFHGDYSVEYYGSKPYTYHPINQFPFWVHYFKRTNPVKYSPKKLVLCYNRILRPHRPLILGLLNRKNLLPYCRYSVGDWSYTDIQNVNTHSLKTLFSDNEVLQLSLMANTSPDGAIANGGNPAANINAQDYNYTFLSLVNETLTDNIFFSEKIYKPILMGHPFLLMSAPNALAQLKQFGFKTFSDYWDESYDTIDDLVARANAIVNIIDKLSKCTPAELVHLRQDMLPILRHNQSLFNEITNLDDEFGIHRDVAIRCKEIIR